MTTTIQAESARKRHREGSRGIRFAEALRRLDLPPEGIGVWTWDKGYPVVAPHTELSNDRLRAIGEAARLLIPWRSGPFGLPGCTIDAEWISPLRWRLLEPHLEGDRLLDVGSGNGFFTVQALSRGLSLGVALDPVDRCCFQFELLTALAPAPELRFVPLSSDHLPEMEERFDTALCLGVLYHHRDPVRLLAQIRDRLVPGGVLIAESITIPGNEPLHLGWGERYTKMRNVAWIPTCGLLERWLEEAGFVEIALVESHRTTTAEQRRTSFAPYESLADFLDPLDPTSTVEGYPAPWRTIIKGRRP
jgi:tRNA (mo5U34)-methyltransferase